MSVEAFRPELAVERLDEAIVGRLKRRARNPTLLAYAPQIEVPSDELAAIIHPDRLRIAGLPADAFRCLNDILASVGEAFQLQGSNASACRPQSGSAASCRSRADAGRSSSPKRRSARPLPCDRFCALPSTGALDVFCAISLRAGPGLIDLRFSQRLSVAPSKSTPCRTV